MKRAIVGLAFLLCACPAFAQKIEVKVDKTVDFSQYKTYFWVNGMPARNPIINKMITDAVDQQLSARGLTKTEAGGDLQVMFAAAVDLDLQDAGVTWSSVSNPMGSLASLGSPMTIRKGTLVVDLTDRKTERYVWRCFARQTLTQTPSGDIVKDARSIEKLVKSSVQKMFSKYPKSK